MLNNRVNCSTLFFRVIQCARSFGNEKKAATTNRKSMRLYDTRLDSMIVLIARFFSISILRVMTSPAAHSATSAPLPARQFRLVHVFVLMAAVALVLAIGTQVKPDGMYVAGLLSAMLASMGLAWWTRRKWIVLLAVIPFLVAMFLPSPRDYPIPARSQCGSNLKNVVLALQNYHEQNGSFPPAYVTDKDGKPLYSWRVLILPFIEEPQLYSNFHLDEPWDSPHNLPLAKHVISVFHCPKAQGRSGMFANYVAIVGDETMWPGETSRTMKDVNDGTSNTLLIVEWSESDVVWSEPRDIPMSELKKWWLVPAKVRKDKHRHGDGVNVGYVDGHVSHLRPQFLSGPELRSLLTPAGNDKPAKPISELER